MVTQKEYQRAPENAMFIYVPTGVVQAKAILRFKMNQIGQAYCKGAGYPSVELLPHEHKLNLHELLGDALEHFELQEEKQPPDIKPAVKGETSLCHKCGLQREDCVIIEIGTKVMRICLECRGN